MSMCAVFAMACCGKVIVFGRVKGDEMYPPTVTRCPFGCAQTHYPNGRPSPKVLRFLNYKEEKSAQFPRVWHGQLVPAAEAIERGMV